MKIYNKLELCSDCEKWLAYGDLSQLNLLD